MEDTEWTLTDSPVIVTDNIQVWPGVTLTIEPGVDIRFYEDIEIMAEGDIFAQGTDELPIVFRPNTKGDYWGGIVFLDNTGSVFDSCIFEYAHNVFNFKGISIPTVINCIFQYNSRVFIDYYGFQELHVTYNDFLHNYTCFGGIRPLETSLISYNNFCRNDHVVYYPVFFGHTDIHNNNIIENGFGIEAPADCCGHGTVSAAYNWWGTTDTDIIDELIWDKYDDLSLKIIEYQPVQTSFVENIGSSILEISLGELYVDPNGFCGYNFPCVTGFDEALVLSNNGDEICCISGTFDTSLTLDEDKSITLIGGCDDEYSDCTGVSTITGIPGVVVSKGELTIHNIEIQ